MTSLFIYIVSSCRTLRCCSTSYARTSFFQVYHHFVVSQSVSYGCIVPDTLHCILGHVSRYLLLDELLYQCTYEAMVPYTDGARTHTHTHTRARTHTHTHTHTPTHYICVRGLEL